MIRNGLLLLAGIATTAACAYLLFGTDVDAPKDEARLWAGLFFFGGTIPVALYRMFHAPEGEARVDRPYASQAVLNSPWGRAAALFGLAGLLAAGAISAFHPASQDVFMGWFVLVVFGGMLAWAVATRIARTGPDVILSKEGIEDRTNGLGRVPWTEIVGFERTTLDDQEFLVLRLRDPDAWMGRRSAWRKLTLAAGQEELGVQGIPIRISGLPVPTEDVVTEVERSIAEARAYGTVT